MASLVNDSNDKYDFEAIKFAVLGVLDKYTFFEDGNETLVGWENGKDILQKKIANEYTVAVPEILRKVRSLRTIF